MIEVAVKYQKPVRIGVNWGSLDQTLLTKMMDENSALAEPKDAREVTMEAMVVSALNSADLAQKFGLRPDQIILSAKVSGVQDLIDVYRALAARCDYPLHLGLTEAGMGAKGVVASSRCYGRGAAGRHRRHDSRFADSRARRRPHRRSSRGAADSAVDGHSQLYAAGYGLPRLRTHHQHILPGDGRADSDLPARADADMEGPYIGVEEMKLAVMGCVVNGPGESKHANIGISLPGTFEEPKAPVYVDGRLFTTLKGDRIVAEFITILDEYVDSHYAAREVEKEEVARQKLADESAPEGAFPCRSFVARMNACPDTNLSPIQIL